MTQKRQNQVQEPTCGSAKWIQSIWFDVRERIGAETHFLRQNQRLRCTISQRYLKLSRG